MLNNGLRFRRDVDVRGRDFFRDRIELTRLIGIGNIDVRVRVRRRAAPFARESRANAEHHIIVERAGVGFLIGDAEVREQFQDPAGFYFQFPGQLINSDLTHRYEPARFRRGYGGLFSRQMPDST